MKNKLSHLKDKIPTLKKSNVVYQISCLDCNKTYIGETSRNLETRINEHRRDTVKKKPAS